MKKLIALVLALVFTLAVCGSALAETPADEATDELVIWLSYGDGSPVASIYQAAVEEFESLYPDVKVTLSCMGSDISAALETIFQDPNSPDFPDIFDGGDEHLLSFAREDLLWDMTEAMQTPGYDDPSTTWGSTFMPSLVEAQKYEGKNVMVPTCFYSNGFFYDANLFEKLGVSVPTTWDEFKQLNEVCKENGIALIACDGALDAYNYWFVISCAERYADVTKMTELAAGNGSFADDPGYLKAAQVVAETFTDGMYQKGFEGSAYPACQAVFAQGAAACHFCGGWLPSEMSAITPDTMALSVFPLPTLPGQTNDGVAEAWGNANAITKDAHNKVNAVNFLKLFSSQKYGQMYVDNKMDSALNNMPLVPQTAGYSENVANATSLLPSNNGLGHLGEWTVNVLGPLSTQLMTGKISPEDFVAQLDAQTAALYAK